MMIADRPSRTTSRARLDPGLRLEIEIAGRLVQDQDPRLGHEGPGQSQELTLAGRERGAALVYRAVEAAQPVDEIVDADGNERIDPRSSVVGLGPGEAHVVADRSREQERLLEHDAELGTHAHERDVAEIVAVDPDAAFGRDRESGSEGAQRSTCRRRSRPRARSSRRVRS